MNADSTNLQPAGLLTNFVDVIAAPATGLKRISAFHRWNWLLPALLALGGGILTLVITLDSQMALAERQAQLQLGSLPPEQAEAAAAAMETFMQPTFLLATGAITLTVSLVLSWLLALLILYLGAAILGASTEVSKLWSPLIWTWLPFGIRSLVQSTWSYLQDRAIIYPGLSYFVATGDTISDQTQPLFLIASQIDLFAIWHVILVYVLLRAVMRMSRISALVLLIIYLAISLGLRMVPALLSGLVSV